MKEMQWFRGVEVSDGIAIGAAQRLARRTAVQQRRVPKEQVAHELERLHRAIGATDQTLGEISGRMREGQHTEGHLILEAHRLMLHSDELVESARTLIRQKGLAAESAVRRAIDRLVTAFEQVADPYLRQRGGDIEALGERLVDTLLGRPADELTWRAAQGRIGVGRTLSPIDAWQLGQHHLSGLVTERGSPGSHAAIIVRGLAIPYVVGVARLLEEVEDGDLLIVDGARGEVIVHPDDQTLDRYRERQARLFERAQVLRARAGRDTRTLDGVHVTLSANVDARGDVAAAVEAGAESVGLLRTELLYLNRADLPSEEEQYQDAVAALDRLGGRVATFRTLDLGGDKIPLSVPVPDAANPALGMRALRFSLSRPELFRTQLRALYRASLHGPLRILFPLVTTEGELCAARAHCAAVREELAAEGTPCPEVPLGAMLETPSAVLTTDHLARHCDFFSLGTNDLLQLTFAADRENLDVRHLAPPLHPAMLRLIRQAIGAAEAAGKRLSLCGDMAANPAYAWVLLGLGLRELSMPPSKLPAVRSVVTRSRLADAQALVQGLLELSRPEEIEARVRGEMAEHFALELGLESPPLPPARSPPRWHRPSDGRGRAAR